MICIGNDIEIVRYQHGWELREYREKQPTKENPMPTGKICKKRWFATLEQAAIKVIDINLPDKGDVAAIVEVMKETRESICKAISEASNT